MSEATPSTTKAVYRSGTQATRLRTGMLGLGIAVLLAGCAGTATETSTTGTLASPAQTGKASYYGEAHRGKRTASGERYDPGALTAAHRTLPFGTRVRVTHLGTGREVSVRINDRGPFIRGRIIDLSHAAAKRLGMIRQGVAPVSLRIEE